MPEPNPQRRREDPAYDVDASFIKKAMDNPIFMRAIQMVVAAGLGAAAGGTSFKVADAGQNVVVEENRNQVLALKQEIKDIRDGFAQRVRVEEIEREQAIDRLRDRVGYIEAKTGHSLRRQRALEADAAAPAQVVPAVKP